MPTSLSKLAVPICVIAVVIIALLIVNPCYEVEAGYVGVLTTFGKPRKVVYNPGLHVVMPIAQAIHSISIQPYTSTTSETAATHDQQNVTTRIAVTFSIPPNDGAFFYQNYRTRDGLNMTIVQPTVSNDVKAIISKYDAQALITERAIVDAEIKEMIAKDLRNSDVLVSAVNIVDLEFSKNYDDAIEAKQIAQQRAEQASYDLQRVKVNAQQTVVTAEADAEAKIASSRGQAQATLIQAKADADAFKLKTQVLTPQILQLEAIQKWSGNLPQYIGGEQPIPFLNTQTAH